MKVNVVCMDRDSTTVLDVSPDMELMNVKALLEAEIGISMASMVLMFQDTVLGDDEKTLNDYGVTEDSLIALSSTDTGTTSTSAVPASSSAGAPTTSSLSSLPNIDWSGIHVGPPAPTRTQAAPSHADVAEGDPLQLRERLLADPVQTQLLSENNPPLFQALVSGDQQRWVNSLAEYRRAVADSNMERIRLLAADPFDMDAQQRIAENIRMENVETNMRTAMEHNPEAFGQVVMLYIDCMLNGHPVKAFVDSGAQMTIVSQDCAERCNIMRLVDRRFAGIARGVGTQEIIGRVHLGQIQIGNDFLQASFSVLKDQKMDLLIGLDMLKRHQCCINLRENVLHIGSTGSDACFLAEKDLPVDARLSGRPESLGSPLPATPSAQEMADKELAEALSQSSQMAQQQQQPSQASAPQSHAASSSASALPVDSPAPSFPEADISRLTSLGFSREDCVAALRQVNGSVDLALMSLFAKSLPAVNR